MTRIVLIHGTTVGVKFSFFRDRCIIDGGFKSAIKELESGTAQLFTWYQDDNSLSFAQCLNPTSIITIYLKERSYAQKPESADKLFSFLNEHQPNFVFSHSLGSHYLISTIEKIGLPDSVRKAFFLMSEAPKNYTLTNSSIIEKVKMGYLELINYYCWWDPTILFSYFITRTLPSGIFGFDCPYITNKFYRIKPDGGGDLHTRITRDRKFFEGCIY